MNTQKIENPRNYAPEQIIKHYLPFLPKKDIRPTAIEISKKSANIEQFNDIAYEYYEFFEKKREEQLPDLLKSIIYNSIGFELNEELKDGIYDGSHDKNMSRYGKMFINSQKKIYRNDYERLFGISEDNVQDILKDVEFLIDFIVNKNLGEIQNISKIYSAYQKNPKAIEGIVNKVLTK